MNALSFYRMKTDKISERYIAPCFVNCLEAYDGEVNLEFDENLISNEFAVKSSIVKFIINLEEDDFEPRVILGRSFMRLAKGVVDFGNGVITIYPEPDPFEDDSEKTRKSSDDWDQLLDCNFDDVPKFREELPPFVCKMGKSNRKKKLAMENFNLFYQDIGPSSSAGDKVELDGKTMKEDEEAVKRIKGEALKEKDDPSAFIFPIKLEGKVNENALADTGSNINTMPYRIYEQLGREDMKKVDRGITMINHTQVEAMGILTNILFVGRGFLRTIDGIVNTSERLFSTFDGFCHQTFRAARPDFMRNAESDSDDEEDYQIKRNNFGAPIYGPKPAPYLNCNDPVNWKPDYKGSYTKEEEATGQW
ncbi:hypothetical protein Tco_0573419 [Tanacetum coccineum]